MERPNVSAIADMAKRFMEFKGPANPHDGEIYDYAKSIEELVAWIEHLEGQSKSYCYQVWQIETDAETGEITRKPADENGYPNLKGHGWNRSRFSTPEDAVAYAINWLGDYRPAESSQLQIGISWDFGYDKGILIEKCEVADPPKAENDNGPSARGWTLFKEG